MCAGSRHSPFAPQSRGFSSLVSPAWLSDSRDRKLLVVDCEHPVAFERGHIPSAQSLGLATTGLKVRLATLLHSSPLCRE